MLKFREWFEAVSNVTSEWIKNNIRSLGQTRLDDPAKVDKLKSLMSGPKWNWSENPLTGNVDDNGVYYIKEGHHRMNAAIELFEKTGNPMYVEKLINAGRWTPQEPHVSEPFPRRAVTPASVVSSSPYKQPAAIPGQEMEPVGVGAADDDFFSPYR